MAAKAKRATAAEAMSRIEGLEGLVGAIGEKLGVSGSESPSKATAKADTTGAKQTRTVKLPELLTFTDEKRGIGVDGTYSSNIAIFKLRDDGTPAQKKDGGIRKPARLRVEDAEFLLAHADEVAGLCSTIRDLQSQESEQPSTTE